MRIVPSSASSEHWLTLMTCIICSNTPDNSPVYRCNLGHTICYPCFQKLVSNGIPICAQCESDKFIRVDVSSDFLKKLKIKPGIGRPCRYRKDQCYASTPKYGSMEESVTVEKLFQLSSSKLQQLFDQNTKDKLRSLNSYTVANCEVLSRMNLKNEKRDEEVNVQSLADESSKIWLRRVNNESRLNIECSTNSLHSRKPLKCPHDPCNKIIAVSSFQSHFKYEHCDFQRYFVERGSELVLDFNPAMIQHEKSLCLGILQLYSKCPVDSSNNNGQVKEKKMEIDTFWVMVSGSPDDRPNHAYAIYWLFTNNDDFYNCTLELTSKHDLMTMTTFCGINGIHESQNINEIAQRLNCLYLTHGTIRSMLSYGPMLKLRIVIH